LKEFEYDLNVQAITGNDWNGYGDFNLLLQELLQLLLHFMTLLTETELMTSMFLLQQFQEQGLQIFKTQTIPEKMQLM